MSQLKVGQVLGKLTIQRIRKDNVVMCRCECGRRVERVASTLIQRAEQLAVHGGYGCVIPRCKSCACHDRDQTIASRKRRENRQACTAEGSAEIWTQSERRRDDDSAAFGAMQTAIEREEFGFTGDLLDEDWCAPAGYAQPECW